MNLSVAAHIPWVGIIAGTILSLIVVIFTVRHALHATRDRDERFSDFGMAYVLAAFLMALAYTVAVGIDMYGNYSEGGGDIGILRSEADRVYDIELTSAQAQDLKDGKVLVIPLEDDQEVVIRLEGEELVTVGNWVPLER